MMATPNTTDQSKSEMSVGPKKIKPRAIASARNPMAMKSVLRLVLSRNQPIGTAEPVLAAAITETNNESKRRAEHEHRVLSCLYQSVDFSNILSGGYVTSIGERTSRVCGVPYPDKAQNDGGDKDDRSGVGQASG